MYVIVVPETGFVTLFTTLARTLEMSKGSDVTGTGCLMKQNFFCVLASWRMREMTLGCVATCWL
jgi:hypothetical protein